MNADKAGLGAVFKHNETAQPNSDLLAALKNAVPQFFDSTGAFLRDKFDAELRDSNAAEARDGYTLGFAGKDYTGHCAFFRFALLYCHACEYCI